MSSVTNAVSEHLLRLLKITNNQVSYGKVQFLIFR